MKTVLLLDDDPVLLELFSDVLSASYSILTATSVDEALGLIQSGSVDALISDLHIGYETPDALFDWICSHNPELASRMILMTGDDTFNLKHYDERITVLQKPLSILIFKEKVAQLFDEQEQDR